MLARAAKGCEEAAKALRKEQEKVATKELELSSKIEELRSREAAVDLLGSLRSSTPADPTSSASPPSQGFLDPDAAKNEFSKALDE